MPNWYDDGMDRIIVYHGSEKRIEKPRFGFGNPHADYGLAFYCSRELEAAKEWANKRNEGGYANKYMLDGRGLRILDLTQKQTYGVLHWFAILMHFRKLDPEFKETYHRELSYLEKRYFVNVAEYDIVIGYRADDAYFRFPLSFIRSQIRLERLKSVYNLGHLGVQIALISEKAFSRLTFIDAIESEPIYKEKYRARLTLADDRFAMIEREERYLEGKRMIDLVKEDD